MKIKNSATWKELLGIELFNRFPAGPMALAFWNTRLDWHPRKKRNNPHSAQKKSPKKTTVVQSGERRSPRYDGCQRDKPATGGGEGGGRAEVWSEQMLEVTKLLSGLLRSPTLTNTMPDWEIRCFCLWESFKMSQTRGCRFPATVSL